MVVQTGHPISQGRGHPVALAIAAHTAAAASVKLERDGLDKATDAVAAADSALAVVTDIAQHTQQQAHRAIAGVVSRCLAAVFDNPYEFVIHFERKRDKTEARLAFVRDGVEVSPLDAAGGGVVDVAAFALRLAAIVLHQPPVRRLVVLDEPFKFVHADNLPRVRALLDHLAAEMGIQFVLVTHLEGLVSGHVIRLPL